jgi:hypothetical protein
LSKLSRGGDGLWRVGEEVVQEVAHGLDIGGGGSEPVVAVQRCQARGLPVLAVDVPAEFEVVGEDEVG